MSHFSYIKTSIREMDLLKKSLTNLNIAWKQEEKEILGYNGETHNVNLVIPQENNIDTYKSCVLMLRGLQLECGAKKRKSFPLYSNG